MARIGTYEEIMDGSSTWVSDEALNLNLPMADWSGYFLFATFDGNGPCQAVNLGVCIGYPQGDEGLWPAWRADPRKLQVITAMIYEGRSYRTYDLSSYTRSDLVYARDHLDFQIADVVRMCGKWPYFELYFVDKVYGITYDLSGKARYAHWFPDHIMPKNIYSYLLFPGFQFSGTITVRGVEHHVSGLGGLDHPVARTVGSPSATGLGYWIYDPIQWAGGCVSNGLYYLDLQGRPVVTSGVTTLPDGKYHPCERFNLKILEVAEGGANSGSEGPPQLVPRKWEAILEGSHGTLSYVARAQEVRNPVGSPIIEATALVEATGEFRAHSGEVLSLKGKGYGEFIGGALKPSLA